MRISKKITLGLTAIILAVFISNAFIMWRILSINGHVEIVRKAHMIELRSATNVNYLVPNLNSMIEAILFENETTGFKDKDDAKRQAFETLSSIRENILNWQEAIKVSIRLTRRIHKEEQEEQEVQALRKDFESLSLIVKKAIAISEEKGLKEASDYFKKAAGFLNTDIQKLLFKRITFLEKKLARELDHVHEGINYALAIGGIVNFAAILGIALFGFLFLKRDIMASIKEQEMYRESETRYKALFDGAVEGILVMDQEERRFLNANSAICRMFGYTQEEMERLWIVDIYSKDALVQVQADFENQKGGKMISSEVLCLRKDGTLFYANINATTIFVGGSRCIAGFFTDITERKKAEQKMNEAKTMAEAVLRAKSQFMTNVSHELRTPLNSVIGFSTVMLDNYTGTLDEKQKEYLDLIKTSGEQLLSLIDAIMDISRIDLGDVELLISSFLIKDLFDHVLNLLKEKVMSKQIEVSIDIADDVSHIIKADEDKLKQILYILVSNAVKFSLNGGAVTLRAKKVLTPDKGEMVKVAVVDNGIGIAREDIENLFLPFQQLDMSIRKIYPGLGLGLLLAKKLAELNGGGHIWAKSKGLGKGSTFNFDFAFERE